MSGPIEQVVRIGDTLYNVVQTDHRVPVDPELRTRFRWRANRRAQRLNAIRIMPSYRHEVERVDGRWQVSIFQNVAEPCFPELVGDGTSVSDQEA